MVAGNLASILCLFSLLFPFQLLEATCAEAFRNSFYPVASKGFNASDHLFVVNDYNWSKDEQLLVQSLQGEVGRCI